MNLDTWLVEQEIGPITADNYQEDPLTQPYITVKEAYDIEFLVQNVALTVHWAGAYESEEYPPARRVSDIVYKRTDPNGKMYFHVQAGELGSTCAENDLLSVDCNTPTEILMWGLWLRERNARIDLRNRIENGTQRIIDAGEQLPLFVA